MPSNSVFCRSVVSLGVFRSHKIDFQSYQYRKICFLFNLYQRICALGLEKQTAMKMRKSLVCTFPELNVKRVRH